MNTQKKNTPLHFVFAKLIMAWDVMLGRCGMLFPPSARAIKSVKRSVALLADEVDHGTPILVAFDRVIEQCHHNRVRRAFRHLREMIPEGESFCDAMKSYPDLFPERFRKVFDTEECQELACALREAADRAWGEGPTRLR